MLPELCRWFQLSMCKNEYGVKRLRENSIMPQELNEVITKEQKIRNREPEIEFDLVSAFIHSGYNQTLNQDS